MGYIKNMNRRYTGMKDIYLLNYSVKGVKTLDQLVSLSFYKKTISKELDTQKYNIKGIYGMNGSGKSGIITSVEILKNLITNSGYLNNPIVQKNLDEIINKKTNELFIETEYLAKLGSGLFIYKYSVTLSKDNMGKYIISHECLSYRKATSRKEPMETIFEIFKGEDIIFYKNEEHDKISRDILKKTMNLLSSASMSALFSEKILIPAAKQSKEIKGFLFVSICTLYI